MKSKILGIGVNDADYPIYSGKLPICTFYITWKNMITRHVKKNIPVATEWLTFSNFKLWMQSQNWQGNELDKDLLGSATEGYSPSTCCFLPRNVNSFLQDKRKTDSSLPIGVSRSRNGAFKAYAGSNGSANYLGTYSTPEQAHEAWREFKHTHSNTLADELQSKGFEDRICNRLRVKYKESSYESLSSL